MFKKIQTRAGRAFDLTRWKSHCETLQHKEARKLKATGKGLGIKAFLIPKQGTISKSRATQNKQTEQSVKKNECKGIFADKPKIVQLYSIYANSEEMNLIYTSKVGSIGQLKSSNCTGAIKSFLDKRRNKIPNCENCFAVQNDRSFRKNLQE